MKKYKVEKTVVHPHPEDPKAKVTKLSDLKIGQRVTVTVRPLKDEN